MEGLMSMLRRIALGACRDLHVFDELKEDIVQDVAVRVLRAGGLMPAAAHWHWIYCIARNRCLDELRKRVVRGEGRRGCSDTPRHHADAPSAPERSYDPKLELMLCVQ